MINLIPTKAMAATPAELLNRITFKGILGLGPSDNLAAKAVGFNLSDICCGNASIVSVVTQLALDLMGLVAFIMVLYASITYLLAYGDDNKAAVAKKTLIWSIVGIMVVFLAKTIMGIVQSTVNK